MIKIPQCSDSESTTGDIMDLTQAHSFLQSIPFILSQLAELLH